MPNNKEKLNLKPYAGFLLGFVVIDCLVLFFMPKNSSVILPGKDTLIYLGLFTAAMLLWQFYRQHVMAYQLLALGILAAIFFDLSQNAIQGLAIENASILPSYFGSRYSGMGHLLFAVFILIGAFQMENIVDFRKIKKRFIWNLLITIISIAAIVSIYIYIFPLFSQEILTQYLTGNSFHYLAISILLAALVKFQITFLKSKHKIYFWLTSATVMLLFGMIAEIVSTIDIPAQNSIFTILSFSFIIFGLFVDNSRFIEAEAKLRKDLENSLFEAEQKTQNYDTIFDQTGIGFAEIDGNYRFLSLNKPLLDILAAKASEVIRKSLISLIDSDGNDIWKEAQAKLNLGKEANFEVSIITKARKKLVCDLHVFPSPGKKGSFYGGKLIVRDVSFRKKQEADLERKIKLFENTLQEKTSNLSQLEEEFRKSTSFYTSLLKGISEIVLVINNNGKCIFINEFGRKISGYKMEEFTKNNLPQFFMDLSRVKADYGQSISVDFKDFEYDWKVKAGKQISCTWNVRFLYDQNKNRIGLIGFGRDSAGKKKLEKQVQEIKNQKVKELEQKNQELQKSQININQLLKHSKRFVNEQGIEPFLTSICKAIKSSDWGGAFIYLKKNERLGFKLKGASISQTKTSIVNAIEQIINGNIQEFLRNSLQIGKSYFCEVETKGNRNEYILLSPLLGKESTAGWLAAISQKKDHTPTLKSIDRIEIFAAYAHAKIETIHTLKLMETKFKDLQNSEELKSEFLDYLSHEIRTPLNSILTISEILQRKLPGKLNSDQLEQIDLVKQNADKILHIVNDVLDLSKIKSGNRELRYSYFSLTSLVQSIIAPMKPLCSEKGLKLDVKIHKRVPKRIFSDKDKISQSLTNIVSNAVKFTDSGKISVTATLEQHGSIIRFSVQDTGIGIPSEKLSNIFQEFRQFDDAKEKRTKGSGLGLSIAKKLIEILGGIISVESKVKKGTTFKIDFPLKKVGDIYVVGLSASTGMFSKERLRKNKPIIVQTAKREKTSRKSKSTNRLGSSIPKNKNGKVILLIDDDEGSLYATQYFLMEEGFQVLTSQDSKSGIKLATEEKPGLILMDIIMPGINGYKAAKQLKSQKSTRNIPIIATTGKALKNDRKKALDAGCVDYLTKPFSLEMLLEKIKYWI